MLGIVANMRLWFKLAHIRNSSGWYIQCATNCFLNVTFQAAPVHGFDVARFTEPGVSGMKTTAFMSARDKEEESEKPARRQRETSLRRKVGKPPIQKLPTREQRL